MIGVTQVHRSADRIETKRIVKVAYRVKSDNSDDQLIETIRKERVDRERRRMKTNSVGKYEKY